MGNKVSHSQGVGSKKVWLIAIKPSREMLREPFGKGKTIIRLWNNCHFCRKDTKTEIVERIRMDDVFFFFLFLMRCTADIYKVVNALSSAYFFSPTLGL